MECRRLVLSGHAVRRMFERGIREEEVRRAIESGQVIDDYPDDTPYPSCLVLGFVSGQPLHVVLAVDPSGQECRVITVYIPDPTHWRPDYRTRRAR